MRTRVLAVGMINSIHFARWLAQFQDSQIDFIIVGSTPAKEAHSLINDMLRNTGLASYTLVSSWKSESRLSWALDIFLRQRIRGKQIGKLVLAHRPHFVHAIELQHAGYATTWAINHIRLVQAKLIVTNYGSDIFWFKRFKTHSLRIRKILEQADFYSAECQRDMALASEYGFSGKFLPVIPNAGGFDGQYLTSPKVPSEQRNLILVKGYHGWVGRAHIAIRGLEQIAKELTGFSIIVFSCNKSTLKLINNIKKRTSLDIIGFKKNSLSHNQMMTYFQEAKIYLGVSLSDGISTSMLEALASGCFPIQTSTSCAEEWFLDGKQGLLIDEINQTVIANKVLEGLKIAKDSGWRPEQKSLELRLSHGAILQKALQFYRLEA